MSITTMAPHSRPSTTQSSYPPGVNGGVQLMSERGLTFIDEVHGRRKLISRYVELLFPPPEQSWTASVAADTFGLIQ